MWTRMPCFSAKSVSLLRFSMMMFFCVSTLLSTFPDRMNIEEHPISFIERAVCSTPAASSG